MFFKFVRILALSAPLFSMVQGDSGYAESCNFCGIESTTKLQCACFAEDGQIIDTTLDLNNCFANAFGYVVYRQNGNFANSCTAPTMSGSVMKTTCGTGSGSYGYDAIDLNDYVGNYNGYLGC